MEIGLQVYFRYWTICGLGIVYTPAYTPDHMKKSLEFPGSSLRNRNDEGYAWSRLSYGKSGTATNPSNF